jgi:flagellar motor component MotA
VINKKALILSILVLLVGAIVLYINPEAVWNRYIFFLLVGGSVGAFLYGIGIGRYGGSKKERKKMDHLDRYQK